MADTATPDVAIVDTPAGARWRCRHCNGTLPLDAPDATVLAHLDRHTTPWWVRALGNWWWLLLGCLLAAEVWTAVWAEVFQPRRWGWVLYAYPLLATILFNGPVAVRRIRARWRR